MTSQFGSPTMTWPRDPMRTTGPPDVNERTVWQLANALLDTIIVSIDLEAVDHLPGGTAGRATLSEVGIAWTDMRSVARGLGPAHPHAVHLVVKELAALTPNTCPDPRHKKSRKADPSAHHHHHHDHHHSNNSNSNSNNNNSNKDAHIASPYTCAFTQSWVVPRADLARLARGVMEALGTWALTPDEAARRARRDIVVLFWDSGMEDRELAGLDLFRPGDANVARWDLQAWGLMKRRFGFGRKAGFALAMRMLGLPFCVDGVNLHHNAANDAVLGVQMLLRVLGLSPHDWDCWTRGLQLGVVPLTVEEMERRRVCLKWNKKLGRRQEACFEAVWRRLGLRVVD